MKAVARLQWVRGLISLLFLTVSFSSLPTLAEEPLPSEYEVKAGDTCRSIVHTTFGGRLTLAEFHRLNPDLDPDVVNHVLKPGQKVRITEGPEANLSFIRPLVETYSSGADRWTRGVSGQPLYPFHQVATRASATAEVRFLDQTLVQLRENSTLVIYGVTARKFGKNKGKKSGMELTEGSLRGGLAAARGEKEGLALHTPAATVKISSRDVKVEVDKKKASRLSVFEGQAQVTAQGKKVDVPSGNGTVTEEGKAPEPPRPLPPAPVLKGHPMVTRLAFNGGTVDHLLAWNKVETAAKYYIEFGVDPLFNNCLVETKVARDRDSYEVTGLKEGRYYARVSALDKDGLQSKASTLVQVAVTGMKVQGAKQRPDGTFVTSTGAAFESTSGGTGLQATVDGQAVEAARLDFPGFTTHQIEVKAAEGGFAPEVITLEMGEVNVQASVTPAEIGLEGGVVTVTTLAKDSSGTRVLLKDATVRVGKEPPVVMTVRPDRVVEASVTIPPSAEARTLKVRIFAFGTNNARAEVNLVQGKRGGP